MIQTSVQQLGVHTSYPRSQTGATHPVPHRPESSVHRARGSGMSPSEQADQTRMEDQHSLSLGSKEPVGPGTECRISPQGEDTQKHKGIISSPPPCQQAPCPHSGAQGHQCLSSSWFPRGPVARPAHCAKAKEVLSDSSVAESMDPRPAAAPCGQGSEPIPGISFLTRRHCHNYPAIPFKCTATIATDRCSVPAMVHSKAGAKHKT